MRLHPHHALFALALCTVSPAAFGNPLADPFPSDSLTLAKGDGTLDVSVGYSVSGKAYPASSLPAGVKISFHDVPTHVIAAYGLLDTLSAWIDFPLVFRKESKALNAEDWGLGDLSAGARWRFFGKNAGRMEAAFDFSGRFPSGDTDIAYAGSADGHFSELPLGFGNSAISPGFAFKWRFLDRASLDAAVSYTFNFSARAEYLQTTLVTQASPDDASNTANLPIGNLKIDWGDEVRARVHAAWRFLDPFTLDFGASYLHRRPTTIDTFIIASSGSSLLLTPARETSGTAGLITLEPALAWEPVKRLRLKFGVEIPVWGQNYPTLALAESLVGNRYRFEARYAF